MSEGSNPYDASRIVVLRGLDVVRKRPGMYVGSVDERGLHHLVFEAAESALNEILDGTTDRVGITLTADGGVRITDGGGRHPAGHAGREDGPALEDRLTVLWCGRPRAARRSLGGGSAGMGIAVVNALSSRLTAEVRRDGGCSTLVYERAVRAVAPPCAGPADENGTVITFWPDAEIFETLTFSFDTLADRFRELAFLNRDLDITLTDDRDPGAPRTVRFGFPGGASDWIAQQSAPSRPDVIGFEREYAAMEGTVEVALCWGDLQRGTGHQLRQQ
ncbi:hypothetical protein AB0I39_19060 [Kitasatospora purpeofusca]|uniref:hypothetical protein n=1 Tax=Kitasatospora purpeofusca TaxID=67352 RepID=UPI0033CDC1F3